MTIKIVNNFRPSSRVLASKFQSGSAYICTDSELPSMIGTVFIGRPVINLHTLGRQAIAGFSVCGQYIVYTDSELSFEEVDIDIIVSPNR